MKDLITHNMYVWPVVNNRYPIRRSANCEFRWEKIQQKSCGFSFTELRQTIHRLKTSVCCFLFVLKTDFNEYTSCSALFEKDSSLKLRTVDRRTSRITLYVVNSDWVLMCNLATYVDVDPRPTSLKLETRQLVKRLFWEYYLWNMLSCCECIDDFDEFNRARIHSTRSLSRGEGREEERRGGAFSPHTIVVSLKELVFVTGLVFAQKRSLPWEI